jgi:hypothetical protein
MTSFDNIDPSLRNLPRDLSFLGDPVTNPATSQDGHHDTDGVSQFMVRLLFSQQLMSFHFQPDSHGKTIQKPQFLRYNPGFP